MKSQQVQPGDKLEGHYTVLEVEVKETGVFAKVEYPDGGRELRAWDIDQEIPLVTGEGGDR